jgi:hypothetical protein
MSSIRALGGIAFNIWGDETTQVKGRDICERGCERERENEPKERERERKKKRTGDQRGKEDKAQGTNCSIVVQTVRRFAIDQSETHLTERNETREERGRAIISSLHRCCGGPFLPSGRSSVAGSVALLRFSENQAELHKRFSRRRPAAFLNGNGLALW